MIEQYDKEIAIYEYEEVLTGCKGTFKDTFSKESSIAKRKELVGLIWRYAITNILRWNFYYARENLTKKIVHMLCLDITLRAIDYDLEVKLTGSYEPVLALAFPEAPAFTERKRTIRVYKQILALKDTTDTAKYPQGFFSDESGRQRAIDLFNYCISDIFTEIPLDELYAMFGDRAQGMKWLKTQNLELPCMRLFHGSPVEYMHNSLPPTYRDDALYSFWHYQNIFDKTALGK